MQLNAMQLRQISAICDALTVLEIDSGTYKDNPSDATVINTEISITTRAQARKLGTVKMGTGSGYIFEPFK